MVNDSARRMQSQGMSLSQYMQFTGMTVDQLKNQARPQAERSIRTRLVLEAVAKAENLQVSEEKLNEEIENMAKAYGMDAAQARERMGEAGLEQMKEDLAVQEAVDFLVAEAKLV
jgi:trigger factor